MGTPGNGRVIQVEVDEKNGVRDTADRYNEGKPRMSLIDAEAQLELARVLTAGAAKYSQDNWRKGMSWMSVCDSLERHVAEWKKGVDHDDESRLHHMAHVMCNAMFLIWYAKHRVEHDDRYRND